MTERPGMIKRAAVILPIVLLMLAGCATRRPAPPAAVCDATRPALPTWSGKDTERSRREAARFPDVWHEVCGKPDRRQSESRSAPACPPSRRMGRVFRRHMVHRVAAIGQCVPASAIQRLIVRTVSLVADRHETAIPVRVTHGAGDRAATKTIRQCQGRALPAAPPVGPSSSAYLSAASPPISPRRAIWRRPSTIPHGFRAPE